MSQQTNVGLLYINDHIVVATTSQVVLNVADDTVRAMERYLPKGKDQYGRELRYPDVKTGTLTMTQFAPVVNYRVPIPFNVLRQWKEQDIVDRTVEDYYVTITSTIPTMLKEMGEAMQRNLKL